MARRVDDIYLDVLISDTGVLRAYRNAALALEVHRVHYALAHLLDIALDMGLL